MSSNQEYPDFRTYTPPRKRRFFFYAYILLLGIILGVLLTNTLGSLKREPIKEEQLSDLAESQLQTSVATQPSGTLQSTFPASIQADYERMVITATQKAKPAVVSIYTSGTEYYRFRNPIWDMFYGPQSRSVSAMGSGVIIDPDGIIITNEHVIKMINMINAILILKILCKIDPVSLGMLFNLINSINPKFKPNICAA